jgi:methylenetetrahydrofolate dehydrogenase (NADP+) / methenyltetrahydrofolate cyclohydrolase
MAEKTHITTEKLIDGKAVAERCNAATAGRVAEFRARTHAEPFLHVIIVGEDPASQTYVRNKAETAKAIGMGSVTEALPASITEAALLKRITALNADTSVHGILVQLPLPKHIDENKVLAAIAPEKDVDGFHVINAGLLATGQQDMALIPCTPAGCMKLIASVHGDDLSGLNAVVVGRSNIVGRPVSRLLEQANATVTVTHSRTKNASAIMAVADILVVAAGRRGLVKAVDVKPGATVIDVGINVMEEGGKKLVRGDVDNAAAAVAGHITPVPGGVGPMTIALLMENTLKAAILQHSPGK